MPADRADRLGRAGVVGPRRIDGRQLQPLLLRHRRPDVRAAGRRHRRAGALLLARLGAASGRAAAASRSRWWRPPGSPSSFFGAMTYRNGGCELPARRRVHHRAGDGRADHRRSRRIERGRPAVLGAPAGLRRARSPTAPTSTTGRSSRCRAGTGVRCTAPALGLAQLARSLLLAAVSFRFLEAPIQRRRFAKTRRTHAARLVGRPWPAPPCLTLALAAVPPGSRAVPLRRQPARGCKSRRRSRSSRGPWWPRTNAVNRPLRVLVTGDSTARGHGQRAGGYQNAHPQALQVLNLSLPGCPITPDGSDPQLLRRTGTKRRALQRLAQDVPGRRSPNSSRTFRWSSFRSWKRPTSARSTATGTICSTRPTGPIRRVRSTPSSPT